MRESRGIRKVLVPVDFSEAVPSLVHYALEIVRARGAKVRLFHVVVPRRRFEDPLLMVTTDPPMLRRMENSARRRLESIAAGIPGISVEVGVSEGAAADRILAEAASWEADVIVIGTHGRGGLKRLVLGSVAESVVRGAPCPVLTVRRSRIAEARPPAGGTSSRRGGCGGSAAPSRRAARPPPD